MRVSIFFFVIIGNKPVASDVLHVAIVTPVFVKKGKIVISCSSEYVKTGLKATGGACKFSPLETYHAAENGHRERSTRDKLT